MPLVFQSIAFPGEMILLGTGTSVGVPAIGCGCAVCNSNLPKNNRTRCAAILGLPEGNLLIDTPPDLRTQLLREGIGMVHAVIFTHEHVDHLYGLDDLRLFPFALGHSVPLYCEQRVEDRIRHAFDYAFHDIEPTHVGAAPQLEIRPIGLEPVEILGQVIQPMRLFHGPRFEVLGFRFGNVAYCTDTNGIPDESIALLQGLDVLVLDALRTKPHPTHFSIDEAMAAADLIGARKTYFTHVSHEFDFETTNRRLPAHRQLAFDGQRIALT